MEKLELTEHHITSPISDADVQKLRAGDIVYISGPIFTARDGVYNHVLRLNHEPPVDIRHTCNVTIQSSPAAAEVTAGEYKLGSLQATAGFRYAKWMPQLLERYGVKAVIGKGGMTHETYQKVFKPHGAVCLSTMGYGLGAIYGRAIKRVRDVFWVKELGISEALWVLEAENLGPLLVDGDAQGNSFFTRVNDEVNQQLMQTYQGLPEFIMRRFGETADPREEVF
ncbi:fumarate hydratase C-terminal domain-containing protein [Chloroflexota bacterium]